MLNPREFVAEMKNLFEGHLELWDREVRTVTENAFNEADQASEGVSSHGFLDVIEIGKWLAAPTARSRDQQVHSVYHGIKDQAQSPDSHTHTHMSME